VYPLLYYGEKMSDNNAEMGLPIEVGQQVPNVSFPVRIEQDGEIVWGSLNTTEEFAGKRVILFGLPGAFTPTCSSQQVPGFEGNYKKFQALGIDEIYCLSVNDCFAMKEWRSNLQIENIVFLPDGNGEFTHKFGAEVRKSNLGFGMRSWRYACVLNDGKVEKMFIEDGFEDNCESDPFEISNAETVMQYLGNQEG
jgi:peroxiredoxin